MFWSKKGLNELADLATADAFREITKRINGGFNGLADRQSFYAVARTVLGVAETPVTRGGAQARPVPEASEELVFERGFEAIQSDARRRRARKTRVLRRQTRSTVRGRTKSTARGRTKSTARAKSPAKRRTRRRSTSSKRKR